jgi:hypothetical protein
MAVYLPGGLGAGVGGSSSGAISSGFSQLGQGVRRGVAMGEDIASNEAARRKKEIAIEDARIAALGAGGGAPPGSIGDLGVASRAQFDATGEEIRAQQALLDADVQRARRIREQQEEQQARALFDSTLRAGGFSVPRPPGRRLRVSRPMMENAGTQLRNPYPEDQTLFDQAGAAIERLQNAPRIGTRRDEGLAQTALQEDEALNEEIRLLRNNQDLNVDTLTPNEAGGFEGPPTIEDLVRRHAEEKARLNPAAEFGLPHGYSGSPQDFARYLSRNTNLPLADRQQAEQRYAAWHDMGVREIATQHAAAEQQRAAALQAQQEQEVAATSAALQNLGMDRIVADAVARGNVSPSAYTGITKSNLAEEKSERDARSAAEEQRRHEVQVRTEQERLVKEAEDDLAQRQAAFDDEDNKTRFRLESSVQAAKDNLSATQRDSVIVGQELAANLNAARAALEERPDAWGNRYGRQALVDKVQDAEDQLRSFGESQPRKIAEAERILGAVQAQLENWAPRSLPPVNPADYYGPAESSVLGGGGGAPPPAPLPIPNSEYAIAYLEASGYGPDNPPPNEKIEKSIKHAADVLANRLSNTGTMPPATDEQRERWGIGGGGGSAAPAPPVVAARPSPVERDLPPLTAAERWTKADDPGWTRYRAEDGSVMWRSPKGKRVTPAALEQGYAEMSGR